MSETAQIPAVHKAIDVMHALASGRGRQSMNALARELGIAPATCFRILNTLRAADWVRPREGGGYELSYGLLPLVEPLIGIHRLTTALTPLLGVLTDQTELACKLSIRQGHTQLVIHRTESPRRTGVSGRVGAKFSVLTGSSGAALLADRPEEHIRSIIASADETVWEEQPVDELWRRVRQCRRSGVCDSIGVHPRGIDTVSAPVRAANGGVIAAVTLMGLHGDLSRKNMPRIKKLLKQCVDACANLVATNTATEDADARSEGSER